MKNNSLITVLGKEDVIIATAEDLLEYEMAKDGVLMEMLSHNISTAIIILSKSLEIELLDEDFSPLLSLGIVVHKSSNYSMPEELQSVIQSYVKAKSFFEDNKF
jgi:hypothetical protein